MANFNQGWWVRVCPQKTESNGITLQSGPDKDDNKVWADWKRGQATDFRLPEDQQGLNKIFFQANSDQPGLECNVCVYFDGQPKKSVHFNGHNENHDIKRDQTDQCDC